MSSLKTSFDWFYSSDIETFFTIAFVNCIKTVSFREVATKKNRQKKWMNSQTKKHNFSILNLKSFVCCMKLFLCICGALIFVSKIDEAVSIQWFFEFKWKTLIVNRTNLFELNFTLFFFYFFFWIAERMK